MATFRAIGATCDGILRLLQQSWQKPLFNNEDLRFEVYQVGDFKSPMRYGVSLFLYRVSVNSVQRTPPSRPGAQGQARRHALPVDLHLLLTPWATDASLQHAMLGWMLRTLESTPILTSGLLNTATSGVFAPDETVELIPSALSNEELFRIWDVLGQEFHISMPYLARVIRLDSEVEEPAGSPVLVRDLEFAALKRSGAER